jgi:hypothetical protein
MFFGEFLCFIGYYVWLWCCSANVSHYSSLPFRRCLLFLLPAVLDITATVCAYIGLSLTFASSFEMLKGLYEFLMHNDLQWWLYVFQALCIEIILHLFVKISSGHNLFIGDEAYLLLQWLEYQETAVQPYAGLSTAVSYYIATLHAQKLQIAAQICAQYAQECIEIITSIGIFDHV